MKTQIGAMYLLGCLLTLPFVQACGSDPEATSESEAVASVEPGSTVGGKIASCHDGDTCTVLLQGKKASRLTVRLAGIDAPEVSGGDEHGQPLGNEARQALNALVRGQVVKVRAIELDPYGRMVGEIYLGAKLVNMQIVEQGLAEAYRWATESVDKKAYRAAEMRAKKAHRGVWSLDEYESPGDFRRRTH